MVVGDIYTTVLAALNAALATAQANAAAAQLAASTAQTAATAAQGTAATAQTTANTAQAAAQAAQSLANSAGTTASTAQSTAASASTAAGTASTNAASALDSSVTALTAAQTAITGLLTKVTKADLLADMKALTPAAGMKVQTVGRTALNDGYGGLYYWDPTSSAAEDLTYYNIVLANSTGVGRWVRSFQRVRVTAGGATVVSIGPVKFVFAPGATDSAGKFTLNLTEEGTAGGTALFGSLWWYDARANATSTGVATAVQTYFMSNTGGKSLVFGNYKANAVTITLSLVYNPFADVGAGVSMLGWAVGV